MREVYENTFNGAMDLLTIWNKDLSDDEISYLYDSGQSHNILQDSDINKGDITALVDFDLVFKVGKDSSLYVDTPNDIPTSTTAGFTNSLGVTSTEDFYAVTPYPKTKKCQSDPDCTDLGPGFKCDWNDYVCTKEVDISCQESEECFTKPVAAMCVQASVGEFCMTDGDCESNDCVYSFQRSVFICAANPLNSISFSNDLSVGSK